MTDMPAAEPARLFTCFGTVLYIDPASGDLRHGPVETVPANLVLVAEATCQRGRLTHRGDGGEHPVVCSAERCRAVTDGEAGEPVATELELAALERGIVGLFSDALFLTAEPDGSVFLSRPVCSTWECFFPSEEWCFAGAGDRPVMSEPLKVDLPRIRRLVVEPAFRLKIAMPSAATKVVVYGYPKWSHGRVYYDVSKHLYPRGCVVDVLNWQEDHAAYMDEVKSYYNLFMTSPDGVQSLFERYGVPLERIIVISHHELDIRMLIEEMGIDVFDKFAGYGVVSEFVYCASLMQGVRRPPKVVSLGVGFDDFCSEVPRRLETVGYASSMSNETYGVEWKRGRLAEAATREAGLEFKLAGSTGNQASFHDMPTFYRSVDAVVMSSLSEAAPLPVMEAAAAGRLVIGTPVGHFPLRAYQGGGILAPIEADKFVAFVVETLEYFKANPSAFVDKCLSIKDAARKFDWRFVIGDWVDLIESAGRAA